MMGRVVTILLPLVVGLHLLGAGPLTDSAWGVHMYAFLPAWQLVLALLALVGVTLAAPALSRRLQLVGGMETWLSPRRRILRGVWLVLAALVFWIFRARHTLLGDGNVITAGLEDHVAFNPRQPLTAFLGQHLFRLLERTLDPGTPKHQVAQLAISMWSALAGVLFVLAVGALARELVRGHRDSSQQAPESATTGLVCALLLTQGYMQLFFGYVEYYALYLAGVALYLWLAMRFLAGRTSFFWVGASLFLCIALHLSGGLLLPSLLALMVAGLVRHDARRGTLQSLGLLLLLAVGAVILLSRAIQDYNLATFFVDVARRAVWDSARNLGYLWSSKHINDFWNEQMLIGPFGLAFLLLVLVGWIWRKPRLDAMNIFLLAVALPAMVVSWMAADSNLGYARNWDLLAPGGFLFAVTAFGLLDSTQSLRDASRAALLVALAVSCFHTAPWIAVNASENKAVRRMAALPLEGGRQQAVVGNWYLRRGEYREALRWLELSHRAFPGNPSTNYLLGVTYDEIGETRRALVMLENAVSMQPDNPHFRRRLAQVLLESGNVEAARSQVDHMKQLGQLTDADRQAFRQLLSTSSAEETPGNAP
jgi:tetratricopeptide (TPR) repeat protein